MLNGKKLIIGCGSGRCGTQSLAKLLNLQKGADVTHEKFHVGARFSEDDDFTYQLAYELKPGKLEHTLKRFSEREAPIVGDVAFYWVNYVGALLKYKPDTRFICLKRDRNEVVESFWLRKDGKPAGGPDLHGMPLKLKGVELAGQFIRLRAHRGPPIKQLKAGTAQNWETYYQESEGWQKRFPDNFKIFPMQALNSLDTVTEMLDFVGIPKEDQIPEVGVWENKRGELLNGRKGSHSAIKAVTR